MIIDSDFIRILYRKRKNRKKKKKRILSHIKVFSFFIIDLIATHREK